MTPHSCSRVLGILTYSMLAIGQLLTAGCRSSVTAPTETPVLKDSVTYRVTAKSSNVTADSLIELRLTPTPPGIVSYRWSYTDTAGHAEYTDSNRFNAAIHFPGLYTIQVEAFASGSTKAMVVETGFVYVHPHAIELSLIQQFQKVRIDVRFSGWYRDSVYHHAGSLRTVYDSLRGLFDDGKSVTLDVLVDPLGSFSASTHPPQTSSGTPPEYASGQDAYISGELSYDGTQLDDADLRGDAGSFMNLDGHQSQDDRSVSLLFRSLHVVDVFTDSVRFMEFGNTLRSAVQVQDDSVSSYSYANTHEYFSHRLLQIDTTDGYHRAYCTVTFFR
ncbi:MAG: hypothetical protein JSS75_09520 [Bacteroidetes bacterium]|nr:hypothetical protein [Bacteroidota bacterium]